MDYTFLRFPGFKKRAVTLSYDDGMVYDKLLVEILNTYGIKCTFNLNSELFAAEATDTRRLSPRRRPISCLPTDRMRLQCTDASTCI